MHGIGCMGTIIIGDMNVHEKQWLKFSISSSPEGRSLRSICGKHNLVECVRAPTRGRNLLDLFLTDLPHLTTTKVHAGVSDHFMVHAQMKFEVVGMRVQPRECFIYKEAQWKLLNTAFLETDWKQILGNTSPDASAESFVEYVLKVSKKFIPYQIVKTYKSSHPW